MTQMLSFKKQSEKNSAKVLYCIVLYSTENIFDKVDNDEDEDE